MSADYNRLFYDTVKFVSVEDGVNPHFTCPNCKTEWEPKRKVTTVTVKTFDFNDRVTFQCPKCRLAITLYVALHKDANGEQIEIATQPITANWEQERAI